MTTNDYDATAARIALQIKAAEAGFLTMRRDELRAAFGMGRITQGLSDQVAQALADHEVFIYPRPADGGYTVRVYDRGHPLGKAAIAVVSPDETTDAPLRVLGSIHRRAVAGLELRSDDVPWLEAFDILLQLATGREPSGWEELRDDRHGAVLAQEVAQALGLEPGMVQDRWLINVATAVTHRRPRSRPLNAGELAGSPSSLVAAEALAKLLEEREAELREAHERSLRAAAVLVLGRDDIPTHRVELGLLGLRRKIEE